MRKRYTLCVALLLLLPLGLWAQQAVQLGRHRFVPEPNVRVATRGALDVGAATGGQHNVLVQFAQLPNESEMRALASQGLVLEDYVGGNAYFALLREGATHPAKLRGGKLTSVMTVRPEWKLSEWLAGGNIPQHARVADGVAEVDIFLAGNAPVQQAAQLLQAQGCTQVKVFEAFKMARAQVSAQHLPSLLALPWVLRVDPIERPMEINNYNGRTLSRASVLNAPTALGGRGLLGKGVRVGIWDGNVMYHPDFGDRVHRQEYELGGGNEAHGTHVAGSVLGAGTLSPDGRGMAPLAQAWTYNFNKQSNGKSAQQEMHEAAEQFGITLTQNSYGFALNRLCRYYNQLGYFASDYQLDLLTHMHPTLVHVFAAGNEQDACPDQTQEMWGEVGYGTSVRRAKNVINVGAVDENGELTYFSSCGPQDDGRSFPTICAKGADVYSVRPPDGYQTMSGTSMACPTTTGTLALVQERYRQLNMGANVRGDLLRAVVANTADDAGRKGLDFQYGYGLLNAEHAVVTFEKRYYAVGSLKAGDPAATQTVAIPAGAKGLRVMLVWNDPASKNQVPYGQKVMINDLDLTVKVGAKSFQPWVLNGTKGHVKDLPERKVDALNNIEQVTLEASEFAGQQSMEISVNATTVTDGKQEYAITWWFDMGETRMLFPAAGEMLVPGEAYMARMEGLEGAYTLEISYDGGSNFVEVAKSTTDAVPGLTSQRFRIPANAPLTAKAVLRVVDAKGNLAQSTGHFTIAPQPKGMKLVQSDCGRSGWKLSWEKLAEAIKGYEVLLGDVKSGEWSSLGTVEAGKAEFDITGEAEQKVKAVSEPIFAVAVKVDDNAMGKRSYGVIADVVPSLKVEPKDLPLVESFVKIPPTLFRVQTGKNVIVKYISKMYGSVQAGSNLFGIVCTQKTSGFDKNDYFNKTKNADNMATLQFCELDLTGMDDDAVLRISGSLSTNSKGDKTTARMRVMSNGTVIPSQLGEVQMARDQNEDLYFVLKKGQKHNLAVEFSGYDRNDLLALISISIEKMASKPDVSLALAKEIEGGAKLSTVDAVLRVTNKGAKPAKGIEIRAYVNGKWQTAQIMDEEIPAYESREVAMRVNLASESLLGELMDVRFEARLEGDVVPEDNVAQTKVNNLGKVLPMGTAKLVDTWFGPMPVDPRLTVTLTEPMVFTDNGGYFGKYSPQQISTLKILPKDPGMRVRVKFTKFKTVEGDAYLGVFTRDIPSSLNVNGQLPRAVFSGNDEETPAVFVSEASDGAITFRFESEESMSDGWVAEVDCVPAQNTLTVLSASASLMGTDAEGEVPIKVKVRNNWSSEVKDVDLLVYDLKKIVMRERGLSFAPGEEKEVEFSKKMKMPLASNDFFRVILEGDDYDASDNSVGLVASYDSYCIPSTITPGLGLTFASVGPKSHGERVKFPSSTSRIVYDLKKKLDVWQKDDKLKLNLRLSRNVSPSESTFAMWVDWNDNKQFEDNEKVTATVGLKVDDIDFELTVPATATPGAKRARLIIAPKTEVDRGPCVPEKLSIGDIRDITVMLHEGQNPTWGDLAAVKLDAGESGLNLPSNRELKLTIANRGPEPYKAKIKVKILVDDKEMGSEELDCTSEELAAHTGRKEFTLKTKADLSTKGKHVVKAVIEEQPTAITKENNEVTTEVVCVKEDPNGFYSIATRKGYALLGDITGPMGDMVADGKGRCVEMLVKIDRAHRGYLVASPGFFVLTTAGYSDVPDNAVAVVLGDNLQVDFTKNAVLTPGVWHHIAVSMHSHNGRKTMVDIYVDGVKQETESGGGHRPAFAKLRVAGNLEGQFDVFRAWKVGLHTDNGAMIRANMYKYVRKPDGKLPDDCVVEYKFDEGPKNAMAFSGTTPATFKLVDPTRIDKEDGTGLWNPIAKDDLISSFAFEGTLGKPALQADKSYKIKFRKGADRSKVKGTFTRTWPAATVKYKGNNVTADTEFDFSGSDPVEFKAEFQAFGQSLAQTIKVLAEEDASDANELLTLGLKMASNKGLKKDLKVDPIASSMLVPINDETGEPEDLTKMKLDFTVSPEAKAFVGTTELQSGVTEVDLSNPIRIAVQAANGTKRIYTLALAFGQTITWELAQKEFEYGTAPMDLTAKSSANLPISYVATNPEVASEADGKMLIAFPGESTIEAQQAGSGHYGAAASVAHKVTVTKKAVTVKLEQSIEFGQPIEPEFMYDKLVNQEDVVDMPSPVAKGAFKLTQAGKEFAFTDLLPVGQYSVEPVASAAYETNYYKVTPEAGTLTITQGKLRMVTFRVTDGTNPMSDVTITLEGKEYRTNAEGVVMTSAQGGKSYAWTASKAEYSSVNGGVDVPADADATVNVQMHLATLELTYKAGEHGALFGDLTQKVAPGADGSPILAKPEKGYVLEWSDGRTDNPRTDRAVRENLTVEAKFVPVQVKYSLEYTIGEGGKLKSGELKQQVVKHQDGTAVEVEANEGYYFTCWSDGRTDNPRTDKDVDGNMSFTAQFAKYMTVPAQMSFDAGVLTDGWFSANEGDKAVPFRVTKTAPLTGWSLDGYFALCNSYSAMVIPRKVKTSFHSTRYLVEGITKPIVLKFDYLFRMKSTETFKVEYTTDGTTWTELESLAKTDVNKRETKTFTLELAKFQGKKFLQFRWVYSSMKDWYVLLDNISVYPEKDATSHTISYEAQPAEGGKFTIEGAEAQSQSVEYGKPAKAVKAEKNADYEFVKWVAKDDPSVTLSETELLEMHTPVLADATYVAIFRNKLEVEISYLSAPAGAGLFKVDGKEVTSQMVKKGDDAKPVTAEARPGYTFEGWSFNGSKDPYTQHNVQEEATIVANFKENMYDVVFTVTAGGQPAIGANVAFRGKVQPTAAGGRVTVTAPAGTHVYEITFDGYAPARGNATVVDKVVNVDIDLQPSQQLKFPVNILPMTNGTLAVEANGAAITTGQMLERGTELTIKVKANDGYKLSKLNVAGVDRTNEVSGGELKYVHAGVTDIEATFVEKDPATKQFPVNFDQPADGALTVATAEKTLTSGDKVDQDTEIIITVKPNAGFKLKELMVNGTDHLASVENNTLRHKVLGETNISAAFVASTTKFKVNFNTPEHGVLKVDSKTTGAVVHNGDQIDEGEYLLITVKPNPGYVVDQFTINGEDMKGSLRDGRTDYAVTKDLNIEVSFKPAQQYTITYAQPEHGAISVKDKMDNDLPTGSSVPEGTVAVATFTPENGYKLKLAKINDEDVTTEATAGAVRRTVSANMTLEAEFVELNAPPTDFTVTYNEPANGTLKVTLDGAPVVSGGKVKANSKIVVLLQANDGYKLDKLMVDGADRSADVVNNILTITVTDNVNIEATFVEGAAPKPGQFSVTYQTPANGTLTVTKGGAPVASGSMVDANAEISIAVKANSGYRLGKLTINGQDRTADLANGSMKFTVTADVTIVATFVAGSEPPITEVEESAFAHVKAYPNPFADEVHVAGVEAASRLLVVNEMGTLVRSINLHGEPQIALQLSELPAGVYLLVVERGAERKTIRLVKSR